MTKKTLFHSILFIVGLLPFIYWLHRIIPQDGWWDELYSLREYTLVNIKTTVTLFSDTNNHIFFNLLNNIFTNIIGVRDFYDLLDHLSALRILQAFFSCITILYTYLIVRKFIDKEFAYIVIAILVSTIPFLNFSLQLRGYNLSMMFFVMTIFHSWNFLGNKKYMDLFLTAISVFLFLYTMPSNIYALIALALTIIADWALKNIRFNAEANLNLDIIEEERKHAQKELNKPFFTLSLVVVLSLIICFLAYKPILGQLLNNRFISDAPQNRSHIFTELLPLFAKSMISARWLILPLIITALSLPSIKFNPGHKRILIISFCLILLPFMLIFIHNKNAFDRNLIVLTPIFAIGISVFIIEILKNDKLSETQKNIFAAISIMYFIITGIWQINRNDNILTSNIGNGIKEQNIYRNYYLCSNYTPCQVAKKIAETGDPQTIAFIIDAFDRVSLKDYLKKHKINSQAIIGIKEKQSESNGNKFNHIVLMQSTLSQKEKEQFYNVQCNLSTDFEFNDYLFLLKYNRLNMKKNKYILISSDKNRLKKAERYFNKVFSFTYLNTFDYVNVYQITTKNL